MTSVVADKFRLRERKRKLPAFDYYRKYPDLYGGILRYESRYLSGEAVREILLVGVVLVSSAYCILYLRLVRFSRMLFSSFSDTANPSSPKLRRADWACSAPTRRGIFCAEMMDKIMVGANGVEVLRATGLVQRF